MKLKSIDHNALKIPILIGDSLDIKTLEPIVKETHVICSTIGPYLEYGKLLIEACVNQRTDYCDITGESPFYVKILRSILILQRVACKNCSLLWL